jgi:hypothetical protein
MAAVLAVSAQAFALRMDTGAAEKTFRVEGKKVSAVEANAAGAAGKPVFICKPKSAGKGKTYFDASGKSLGEVEECTPQELVVSKNGGTKFKAKK